MLFVGTLIGIIDKCVEFDRYRKRKDNTNSEMFVQLGILLLIVLIIEVTIVWIFPGVLDYYEEPDTYPAMFFSLGVSLLGWRWALYFIPEWRLDLLGRVKRLWQYIKLKVRKW